MATAVRPGSRALPRFRFLITSSLITLLISFFLFFGPFSSSAPAGNDHDQHQPNQWDQLKGQECFLPGVDLEAEGFVQMCDQTNSHNWFIYCSGKLVHAIRYHKLKDYFEMPLKRSAKEVWTNFEQRFGGKEADVRKIDRKELLEFLEENFENTTELVECELPDWKPDPSKLAQLKNPALKEWANHLNGEWKKLCRRIPDKVRDNQDRHSLIYVSQPFIVPGGEFKEFYYWDTYWSIKGLLVSGLTETVKNILRNFFEMIDRFGFIPNGGRVKYSRRSQPPFLVMMVEEYVIATNDMEFLREAMPFLEKEFEFWNRHRSVRVQLPTTTTADASSASYEMFRYRVESNVPRSESFCLDLLMARDPELSLEERRGIWTDLASAAESGWDFSTRWLKEPEGMDMRGIDTGNTVPVELNAYMCGNYAVMARLHAKMGNSVRSDEYHKMFSEFRNAFQRVFWVDNDPSATGPGWYDFNIRTQRHNTHFYASMVTPLYTGCFVGDQPERAFRTMKDMGALDQPGGVPMSMINSGQQWDFPNGWPPLNHMMIEALRRTGTEEMRKKALELAKKWINTNLKAYKRDNAMWEKYRVDAPEGYKGGGGEYEVQPGFGWTNGVVLDLLSTYGDQLL